MSLTALQEQRGRLFAQAREATDEIKKNTDEARSAELNDRADKFFGELDALDAVIAKEERLAKIESEMEERAAARRPNMEGEARGADGGASVDYRMAFAKAMCGPLDNLTQEERAVLRTGSTAFEARAQTAGTTTAGGFTVPTTLEAEIIKSMLAWGPMYDENVARVISTPSGNPMKVPTINDTAVTAVAHTEATALTDDGSKDATFGQKSLDAYAFDTEFIRWSWELDVDSIFAMESLLGDLLGERLARIANSQLTTGSGSSAPNGVVTASTLGKTAAGVAALTGDELIDLEHSVNRAYRKSPKAAFMMNDLTLKAVRKLKDGNGAYIWQMGNIQTGTPENLLGYKVHVNDSMADLATGAKTVLFGDFGKYFVRKVGSTVIGVMRERFWPDLGIAGLIRFDGELGDTAAIKHLIQA